MRSTSSEVEARRSLLQSLRSREDASDLARRLAKCGEKLVLRCYGCDAPREVRTRCDLKWCPTCQRALAARSTDRYKRVMDAADIRWPLFVTFTVQHSKRDTWELIRDVRRGLTKMRRQRWFKQAVRGGIDAFEAQNDNGGLHPHAHCLYDCRWFAITVPEPKRGSTKEQWARASKAACKEIAEQWALCVGRKGSIKVRRVWKRDGGDIGGALAEVIKYSVCGSDIAAMKPDQAVELIRVLDRTRMLCSHGTLFRHPSIKRVKPKPGLCECGCADWKPEAVCGLQHRIAVSGKRRC